MELPPAPGPTPPLPPPSTVLPTTTEDVEQNPGGNNEPQWSEQDQPLLPSVEQPTTYQPMVGSEDSPLELAATDTITAGLKTSSEETPLEELDQVISEHISEHVDGRSNGMPILEDDLGVVEDVHLP